MEVKLAYMNSRRDIKILRVLKLNVVGNWTLSFGQMVKKLKMLIQLNIYV